MPRTDPLISDLKRLFGERAKTDAPTLTAYAIDAGIHRVTPRAVVLAERREDIPALLRYAWERGVPVTARSAGTNLTGNAIGPGIILDCSRLNRILEVNREGSWARVEPGVVYAELNKALEPAGFRFAPDPSSGDACKLGGMLGNNAAGPRTLKYGATKDNVLDLTLYLADGSEVLARPYALDDPALRALTASHPAFQELFNLVKSRRDLIAEKKPRVSKNSSGYNLFALAEELDRGLFDLPRLFVGSEGTLGIAADARIRLIPRPARTVTGLLYFHRLEEVGEAVNALLPLRPSALEMMDRYAMDLVGRERHGIPPDAMAMLLLELDEDDVEAAIARAEGACAKFSLARKMETAMDVIRAVRNIRTEMNIPQAARIECLCFVNGPSAAKDLAASSAYVTELAKVSRLDVREGGERPRDAAMAVAGAPEAGAPIEVYVPLKGHIVVEDEVRRLGRELEKHSSERGADEARLSSGGFAAKAPAEVVEKERARLAALSEKMAKVASSLERVKSLKDG